jgi:drug/metabolite transporter (DMT)-like permease
MPRLPPAQIALILNLEPIISTLSAVLILDESVAGQTWLGILVMLAFLAPATLLAVRPAEAKSAVGR